MNLHRLICLSGLLLFTTVGCCHTQCVSSDPCNPCARPSGGCCLSGWFRNRMSCCSLRQGCQNYGWDSSCCPACGGTDCGMSTGFDGGMTSGATGGSSCGCGQSHGNSYAPSGGPSPVETAPIPIPSSTAPIPPKSNEGTPAPASESTTFAPANGQVQHVSMEEFQRLPGTVISGPTPTPSPTQTAAVPVLQTPPPLSTISAPPRANVQQAQWVPAK
jgi:hypothetical protein